MSDIMIQDAKNGKNKNKENPACDNKYAKKCGLNSEQLRIESQNREELLQYPNEYNYLYPSLDDPNFNVKIAQKKEFSDAKYDGSIQNVEEYANILKNADYELLPQQIFVRNFLSFQTPYNSLLLFHGLGSGKTCSAIGICEEMRDYLRQMGINKQIIIVASPNVQNNFRLQLFDERSLKEVDGIWTTKGCLGNKLLKEINPTSMKGLSREKVIQLVKNLIANSYSFVGYLQFSNEIVKFSGNDTDSLEIKIRNLENAYSNSLIVIDEVHNIRITEDNENKNVAKNLVFLVNAVSNLRLLLLSATPMFNSYKEIVWLLNLLNMNDRRAIVSMSDIFNKHGEWKKDSQGNEIGRDLLIQKATGYISYVRGENPYTFPFRVYPDRFAPNNTFPSIESYPKYQINGRIIPNRKKITKLSLFLTPIGEYQKMGYNYIIDRLRQREETYKMTKTGAMRKMKAFAERRAFGYTDLQIPIESLNIVYPFEGMEALVSKIRPMKYIDEEEADFDISPHAEKDNSDIVEEIDEITSSGPIDESMLWKKTPKVEQLNKVSKPTKLVKHKDLIKRKDSKNVKGEHIIEGNTYSDILHSSSRGGSSASSFEKLSSLGIESIHDNDESIESSNDEGSIESSNDDDSIESNDDTESIDSESIESSDNTRQLYINVKELTGIQGLKRVMNWTDSKTPAIKGQYEYRTGMPHVFSENEIGKYSSKIKNVCKSIYDKDTGKVADGIILIYSTYIDAGIIPMALALEEMGFIRHGDNVSPLFKTPPVPTVDVRTMKPPTSRQNFKPARYIMITGDTRLSPNNDMDVKHVTDKSNLIKEDENGNIVDISGEIIKVVLISQAGSEGLDFKAIRQVHILEPWYNVNRLEQIIGRAVRNFSHKDLPFSKRNVQIFMYATLLENSEEEAVDLYVYRMAELKAITIGKVARLLKQTSADCIINHEQTQLVPKNFMKIKENQNITQILSDHQVLNQFIVGDIDNSSTCDFMECEFKCLPDADPEQLGENVNTYNETFMIVNADKIIQKIKSLMKIRHFYKKADLIQLINIPKKYPTAQIFSALTQMINDNVEYIVDKYGRTGYLVNIGEYYLFQPSELNNPQISIHDRTVPIDYKHKMIHFHVKSSAMNQVIDKRDVIDEMRPASELIISDGKKILDAMFENYKLTLETNKIQRGDNNWYSLCGVAIRKLAVQTDINVFLDNEPKKKLELLELCLIEHIVDTLMMDEKIHLLNYIYSAAEITFTDAQLNKFFGKIKKYLMSKVIVSKGLQGMVIFDGISKVDNLHVYVLNELGNKWIQATPEDIRDLNGAINQKYQLTATAQLNRYVGFIGFEVNRKYMVFQIKDTENARSKGFRCDQAEKKTIVNILNDIEVTDRFTNTKEKGKELCVRQEFVMRLLEKQEVENKRWFLDTETAIINEFQKKEKENK
jgi:superfamily II DNA or RNA helicase